jgi:polyhydroxyalkanoic acid synthase PhaR subunit
MSAPAPSDRAKSSGRSILLDPFRIWRQIYEASEQALGSALEKAMATRGFADANGKVMEVLLLTQRSARESMHTFLQSLNVPTREDIARLGQLVIALEEKVDQVDDRLERIEAALAKLVASQSAKP